MTALQPNEHGVYAEEDCEVVRFAVGQNWIEVELVEARPGVWCCGHNFRVRRDCHGNGAGASETWGTWPTREQALEAMLDRAEDFLGRVLASIWPSERDAPPSSEVRRLLEQVREYRRQPSLF